jgi:hypothetical protein
LRAFLSVLAGTLLVTATLLLAPAEADRKRPSLPMAVANLKTIYVDNETTAAELQNTVYAELMKWGRFEIASAPEKADIILRLSSGNYVKFVPGETSKSASASQPSKENSQGADQAVPPGSTRISLIDPKSGNSLWSDVRKSNTPKAASHLLDSLREAFDHSRH